MSDEPRVHHEAMLRARTDELRGVERRSLFVSLARVATFLLGGAAAGAWYWAKSGPSGILAIVCFLAFAALVVFHARVVAHEERLRAAVLFEERGIARATDDYAKLPARGEKLASPPPYANDLDLFGGPSILQLLDAMETELSQSRLAAWLSSAATVDEVRSRQAAVRELAKDPSFAADVFVASRPAQKEPDLGPFLAWCTSDGATRGSQLVPTLFGVVLPAITLAMLFFPSALHVSSHAWLVPGVVQAIAALRIGGRANAGLTASVHGAKALGPYAAVLDRLAAKSPESPRLRALDERLRRAREALRSLRRLADFAEARESGIFRSVIGPFVLYDLHLWLALRRWGDANAKSVPGFVDDLGDLLALTGVAAFAFDNPSYAWPDVDDGAPRFRARGLAHPLVPRAVRVGNDVVIDGPGTALLVTGSNMSGKSTLLRAIGVAAVMALAGAPVCAEELSVSRVLVRTSIRVADSLARGVSHFYAELLALKRVTDDAERGPVLFLLDEILHGTNSLERHAGAKAIVKHLLAKGAMGAVSTHDVALVDVVDELAGKIRAVHLVEQTTNGEMTFDHRLREGVLTSGNALRLMKQLGLPVESPSARDTNVEETERNS